MSYYTDVQYADELLKNAKKDLDILFFKSFLKDSKKILDVGCSVGRIMSLYSHKFQGIDVDKKALKIAKNKGLKVKYADVAKKLPFKDEMFDAVYCSHVIEHMESPLYLMKEINRVLKEKGKAVVITPDYIMTSRKYNEGFWCDYTHKQPFIPHSLKEISYDSGFSKFRVYHFPGKGFRNLMRIGLLSKRTVDKIRKVPIYLERTGFDFRSSKIDFKKI